MHPKHEFRVQWVGTGAFVAKNSDNASWHELLYHFGPFSSSFVSQLNGPICTKILWNAPKLFLGSNGVDRVRSLQKIPTRLRGTNFCTSSARFAPSFVSQPNGPQCTKIVRNAPEHEFRVQWDGSVVFIWKLSMRLRTTNFCTSSARFAPSFVSQPNGPKCTKIVRNAPNTWV